MGLEGPFVVHMFGISKLLDPRPSTERRSTAVLRISVRLYKDLGGAAARKGSGTAGAAVAVASRVVPNAGRPRAQGLVNWRVQFVSSQMGGGLYSGWGGSFVGLSGFWVSIR